MLVYSTDEVTLSVVARGQRRLGADLAIVAAASGESGPSLLGEAFDAARSAELTALLPRLGFKGKADQTLRVPAGADDAAETLLFVGVGEVKDSATPEQLRRAAGVGARASAGLDKAVFLLPAESEADFSAVAEGASLGAYAFTAQKSSVPADAAVLGEAVIATDLRAGKELKSRLEHAAVVARHTKGARNLVDAPANVLFPQSFTEYAQKSAKGLDVKITVWDEKKLESEGMGGILGVGKGSARPPRLVKVDYSPSRAKGHLALVGKGITFDTGGISLKVPAGMEEMKSDMAGAATVLHAALAAAELKLPVRVTAWLCLAENMPGPNATRPGDVLTMHNSKTVEVTNTDAEGRLVMADGLSKASEEAPDLLLDVATLTGAQMVALGERVAGLMGDDAATTAVMDAAELTGEQFWPMPLPENLRADLDSATADLRNSGNRNGGMLKAGVFLREFVGAEGVKDPAWGHLDVAGPAFNTGAPWGFTPKEGTGFGVRTLVGVAEALPSR